MMRQRGQGAIQALGLVFVTLFTGAFAIDSALYFTAHRGMQNAADAAALAAIQELFKQPSTVSLESRFAAARNSAKSLAQSNMGNNLNNSDIDFGYVDPITGQYNAASFSTPTNNSAFSPTGGYNAVRVTVRAAAGEANNPIPAIFANYFGINTLDSAAQAVAIWGGGVTSARGLRPIYMCQAAWNKAQELFGDPTIPEITFYGDTLRVGNTNVNQADSCGNMTPGNWGLADLSNSGGAPGSSEVRSWFGSGYPGHVHVNQNYQPQTGTSLHSYESELNNLVNSQAVITIPLYDSTYGTGDNTTFHISQIAAFVVTDYKTTGNQSQRYLKGYFRKMVCTSNCQLGNQVQSGQVTKLRLIR